MEPTPTRTDGGERTLEVGPGGTWFRPPGGDVVVLTRRKALARLLCALADARRDRPGQALSRPTLIERGWPGERILPKAAGNRLGVALTTLRKLGLGRLLQRTHGGYRLDPAVAVVRAD